MKLLLIIILSILIGACQKENDAVKQQAIDYEEIGKLHNEGLDYVLKQIKNQPKTRNGGKQISFELIYSMVDQFLETKGFQPNHVTRSSVQTPIDSITLSPKQKKYYDMVMSVFDTSSTLNEQQAINYIIKIEEEIRINCSKTEQLPLLCGSSIAKHTIVYWSEKLPEWINEIIGDKKPSTRSANWSWKDFGGADVAGAVSGAIAGAIGGAFIGGVGAAPGAVVGGVGVGIGSSAGYAAQKLWDWIWD